MLGKMFCTVSNRFFYRHFLAQWKYKKNNFERHRKSFFTIYMVTCNLHKEGSWLLRGLFTYFGIKEGTNCIPSDPLCGIYLLTAVLSFVGQPEHFGQIKYFSSFIYRLLLNPVFHVHCTVVIVSVQWRRFSISNYNFFTKLLNSMDTHKHGN